MAHAATLPARRDVLFHLDAFAVGMLGFLFAGVVLLGILWATSQVLGSGDPVGSSLTGTATILERHAAALSGDRVGDATAERELAARLRQDARTFGDHPAWATAASAEQLAAKSDQIAADGARLIARGEATGDATLVEAGSRLRAVAATLSSAAYEARGMLRR